jgi:CMP-N,N'-diacetyllegionaminic acid synthase
VLPYDSGSRRLKKIFALIPARKGSKRLPRKNILLLDGIPLVAWSIRAAHCCPEVEAVLVSTDDDQVADIAEKEGAEVQWRPQALAADQTTMLEVLDHSVSELKNAGRSIPGFLVLLQPTSPLREQGLIEEAIRRMNRNPDADRLIEVVSQKIFSGRVDGDYWRADFPESTRSQDLPEIYSPSGRLFVYRVDSTIAIGSETGKRTVVLHGDFESNINIDSQADFDKLLYVYNRISDRYSYLKQAGSILDGR